MADDRQTWDIIAPAWDESVGDGSDFQKLLVFPTTDAFLQPGPGQRILDVCCGNGNYTRRLGRNGCEVVAFDGSAKMIELARARTRPEHGQIAYAVADACDEASLNQLTGPAFDAVVCSMAMMDLPTLDPLLRFVRRVLKPGSPFVFSVGHPAFHTNEPLKFATQSDGGEDDGAAAQTFGLLVTRYLTDWPHPSRGLLTQPVPNMLYHRPLSGLLRACFSAGFTLDALEEPAFPPDTRLRSPFSWARRPDLPPVLICRLR